MPRSIFHTPAILALSSFLLPVAMNGQVNTVSLNPDRNVSLGYHDNFGSENTNYNSSIHHSCFSQSGAAGGVNKGRGLMDFDLSSIPTGSTVFGAFLSLSAMGPFGAGEVGSVGHMGANACALRRVTSAWDVDDVTWNTQPTTTDENLVALLPSTYSMQNYISIDATALVQDIVNDPENSHGFMLTLDNETPSRGLAFHSSVADDVDRQPLLTIVYGECDEGIGMSENYALEGGMSITPNLTRSGALIRLSLDAAPASAAMLTVTDQAGRTVHNEQAIRWPYELTVPALAQGVYTLSVRARSGELLGTGRFTVQ